MSKSKISNNYLPILEDFVKNGGMELLIKSGYDQGPFIPYVFENYEKAPVKIVYCGIDTYCWTHLEDLKNAIDEDKIDVYLTINKDAMNADKVFDWGNTCSFWGTVARLQLMIRTGKYYEDITNISKKEEEIIKEVGYSNLNSLELPKTFNKREGESCANESYNKASILANSFTSIKTLLDSYEPDYIFILTWSDKDEVFEGLERLFEEKYYEESFRSVFSIKNYKTKIIWSTHPSRYRFLGTNMEEMVKYLYDSYQKVHNNDSI